ncbi:MAG: LysM peptidoglycan-binding domain-containing protein [Candidatus Limisoma sp.]|nr:LysM peptidoglycan-binding domain-containing protein [Candidatus Limisoma sp.]
MKKLLAILILAGSAVSAVAAPTVLSIKESITDDAIVYPYSFETDTEALRNNWYLKNFAVLDTDVQLKNDVPTSKEDYIERLQALPTIIEMPYNDVVRSYINMYTGKRRGLVEQMLGLSIYYMPFFEQALEKEGMPLELKYLPVIESALNPDAVSPAGAAGLWQFMIGTAKDMGLTVNSLVDERRDPIRSSEAAARYLKQLYKAYGDWSLAIASYNCGPGSVNRALRRAGGGKKDFWDIYYYLPSETRGYVPAFIAANYVMNYYEDHNIGKALSKRPVVTDTVMVKQDIYFEQISEVLGIPIEELKILNPQYRKNIIPGNTRPYALTLPSKQCYAYISSEDSIKNHKADVYRHRSEVNISDASDGYTTVEKRVTKSHRVRSRETISQVARKYGVTTSQIKKWNGLRSNKLKKNQVLKIYVTQRVKVPVENNDRNKPTTPTAPTTPEPDTSATTAQPDNSSTEVDESTTDETEVVEPKPEKTVAVKYHKVRRGETLGSIARRYGISVSQLKRWNGLRSNTAKVGTTLKVSNPAKQSKSTTTTTTTTSNEKQKYYTVKRGDSLSSIAERFGVTVAQLREWNGIEADNINAGVRIAVDASASRRVSKPEVKTSTYTVKKGDGLGAIAERHGMTLQEIRELNGLKDNNIQVGQKLKVTGKASEERNEKPEVKTSTYTVKKGDGLGAIAERHGMTLQEIRELNGLKNNNIQVGQKLKVTGKASEERSEKPEAKSSTYTVKKGDSLGAIAERFGVTVDQLRDWNGIKGNNIQAGQKLTIGGKSKSSSKAGSSKSAKAKSHKVRSGESLGVIAEKYGTTASAIRRANGIKGDNIRVGQTLKIPAK